MKLDLLEYDIKKDGFTQSSLTSWMKCPVKARNGMKGLYKAGFGSAIMFGSVFHEYMDVMLNMYRDEEFTNPDQCREIAFWNKAKSKVVAKFSEEYIKATSEGKDIINECHMVCEVVVPEYFNYWKLDFFGEDKKEWVEIEGEFKVNVTDGTFRGKRDGVFISKHTQGRAKWLFETKTKSRFDDDILMKIIPRDFQVLCYMLAWYLEHNEFLKGVLYNVIRKPQLRQTKKETTEQFMERIRADIKERPDFYFSRYLCDISENEIINFSKTFQRLTTKFSEFVHQPEEEDMQHTHECNSIYGACSFIDYCASGKQNTMGLDVKEKLYNELA